MNGEFSVDLEVMDAIAGRSNILSTRDVCALSRVSSGLNGLFKPIVEQNVLADVVAGNEKGAVAVIESNPKLLLSPSIVWRTKDKEMPVPIKAYDHTKVRSYHNVTPFEAALMTGDTDMCNAFMPYFATLRNGRSEMLKQIIHVFSKNDFDMKSISDKTENELSELAKTTLKNHEERQKNNTYSFDALVNAISRATNDQVKAQLKHEDNGSELNQTVLAFRKEFEALSQSERVYNPYHLLKAMKVYNEQFDNWDWNKRDLFWRQVNGYTQRFMPICYMQAFCHGLYDLTKEKDAESLKRNTSIHNYITSDEISLDKLDNDLKCRLGFDFAVYSYGLDGPGRAGALGAGTVRWASSRLHFQNLCRAKTACLWTLCDLRHFAENKRPGV